MITGSGLHKSFNEINVLKGVDLSINKGEIVSIVGPSGSGKSTLLHILGTLDKPDSGKVIINGTDTSGLNEKKLAAFRNKEIGFVFQFHHLLPEFSALENVCIPGWIAGRNKQEVQQQATELLKLLGVAHRLENKPGQLSGGEQQRVSVARALINNPGIIFADEPTGNLDTENAIEMHQLFVSLRNNYGHSFLIVTHNQQLANISDRVLQMKDGLIV